MLKKIAISLLTAGAMGAAVLAPSVPAAAAPAPDRGPASGPVTAMSWHHSGFYANGDMCTVQLVLLRGAGATVMPTVGPCHHSAQGYYFFYWS